MKYHIKKAVQPFQERIFLSSSKSESNRALIINALCNPEGSLENLSTARDTQTMIRLLASDDKTLDVLDAGTTMRFLTAFISTTNQNKILTGTPRMCERPIGILVDALRHIGVIINYLKNDGYPPLEIIGFKEQKNNTVQIRGDVSSQYISALLMIAPTLPKGLEIQLTGEIGSIPYIKMTIAQMRAFGVDVIEDWQNKKLIVTPQAYRSTTYKVESDWSGASYWYSIVALSPFENTEIELIGLKQNSLQGDSVIVDIMSHLGVKSTFTKDGILLSKIPANDKLEWDFTDCPDLAQTVAVVAVAKSIPTIFTGIESLKIKETDRVLALQNELKKIGGEFKETIKSKKYELSSSQIINNTPPEFDTYDDHRMAMAFAPLSMLYDVIIHEPHVVAKSYPSYWEDISKIVEYSEM
ncbi:MAG: 3-phosphoshikimate 1-carboxyvinyltransferase [Leadbetterella sp.]